MAFNVRSGGKANSVPVANTIKSGDLVRVGNLVGIAEIDAQQGRDGNYYTTLALEGIAHSPITGAVTVGAALYTTDAGPGLVGLTTNGSAAGTKLVGIATRAKASGAGEVWYKLVPNVTITPTP